MIEHADPEGSLTNEESEYRRVCKALDRKRLLDVIVQEERGVFSFYIGTVGPDQKEEARRGIDEVMQESRLPFCVIDDVLRLSGEVKTMPPGLDAR